MSHKTEQVAAALHRAVAETLSRGLNDPRMDGSLVGVTHVDVSPDLRNARVYVSVLPDNHRRRVLAALKHATRYVQTESQKRLATRLMPHLEFRFDEKLKKQHAVLEAISEAVRRTGPAAADTDSAAETDAPPAAEAPAPDDTPGDGR